MHPTAREEIPPSTTLFVPQSIGTHIAKHIHYHKRKTLATPSADSHRNQPQNTPNPCHIRRASQDVHSTSQTRTTLCWRQYLIPFPRHNLHSSSKEGTRHPEPSRTLAYPHLLFAAPSHGPLPPWRSEPLITTTTKHAHSSVLYRDLIPSNLALLPGGTLPDPSATARWQPKHPG